jgi:CelD/BcsL family acetyltransferase involved in cellulose biosynthesis
MAVYRLDPLTDPRWLELLERHPSASAFHTPGWLRALQRTYQYEPVVYTTTPPGRELENGIAFCRVKSWLTGRRLVSLPFSDHCQPLVDDASDMAELEADLAREQKNGMKYIELRPLKSPVGIENFGQGESYAFHEVELKGTEEELFSTFHKRSTQRNIKKAEKEGLTYLEGKSPEIRKMFYAMMIMTRRRHQVPPQPAEWFANVLDCMGEGAKIWIALKECQPVAGECTLFYKQTLVYKYGCSDPDYSNLGGTCALFWRAMREAKSHGATLFDLGRSDLDNQGLVSFKDHWGARRSNLTYYRLPTPVPAPAISAEKSLPSRMAHSVFAALPDPLFIFAGRALYRHRG